MACAQLRTVHAATGSGAQIAALVSGQTRDTYALRGGARVIYLFVQTFTWLLLATLLGFVTAWLLRGTRLQSRLSVHDRPAGAPPGNSANTERKRIAAERALADHAQLQATNSELRTELARFESEQTELKQMLARAQSELDAVSEHQRVLDEEQRLLEAELVRARAALAQHAGLGGTDRARLAEALEAERTAHTAARAALEAGHRSENGETAALRQQLSSMTARCAACERERDTLLAESGKAQLSLLSDDSRPNGLCRPEGATDDLQRIKGIGPKIAQTLNELGIYYFEQLAEFTPENIAWVNDHLSFSGRIERERWVEQATTLAGAREKEFSRRYDDDANRS